MALRRGRGRANRLGLHLRLRDRHLGLLGDSLELGLGRCDGLRLRDGDGFVACGCGAVYIIQYLNLVGRGQRDLRLRLGLDLGAGFGVVLGADGVCLDGNCLGSAVRLGVRLGLRLVSLTINFSREMG